MTHTRFRQLMKNKMAESLDFIGESAVFVWLKGKSTLMIFERHANLKYKYGNRHFWCCGYYVDTVWKNAKNTGIMSL